MKKMIGVSCLQSNPDVQLMKQAGIEWVRALVPYPFADEDKKELSERYIKALEKIKFWKDHGFKISGVTTTPGMMYAQKNSPSLKFVRFIPDWVGNIDEQKYYDNIQDGMEYVGRTLKGVIDSFQIANELDITRFRGDMTQEQAADFIYKSAKGIKKGNKDATVYINTSCMTNPESTYFYERLYSDDCDVYFDYAGVDYYFGSHHPGVPEDWEQTIQQIYDITKRPIIIAEWGYSSIGEYIKDGWPAEPNKAPNENGEFWVCARHAWAYAWKGAHTPEIQAEYYEIALKIFAENKHVIGFFQYDWQDDAVCFCGRKNCPHECGWGMIDSDGKPKPAYYTFKNAVETIF